MFVRDSCENSIGEPELYTWRRSDKMPLRAELWTPLAHINEYVKRPLLLGFFFRIWIPAEFKIFDSLADEYQMPSARVKL